MKSKRLNETQWWKEQMMVFDILEDRELDEEVRAFLKTALEKKLAWKVLSMTENDFVGLFRNDLEKVLRKLYLYKIADNNGHPVNKRLLEKCGEDGHLRLNAFVKPIDSSFYFRRWTWQELCQSVAENPENYLNTTHLHMNRSRFTERDIPELEGLVKLLPSLKWITVSFLSSAYVSEVEALKLVNKMKQECGVEMEWTY